MSKNKHTPFVAKPIDFALGDEASMSNRYEFREWSIEPFVLQKKELVTEDNKPNYKYIELKQSLKHKGYIYIIRIFSEKKVHHVQVFHYVLGSYPQAVKLGDYIETDSIIEARAICFNWYLSNINKRRQTQEGFLIESEEERVAKQPIFNAAPWTMRWIVRRVAFAFFSVVGGFELVKAQPMLAATLGGYTAVSVSVVILFAWGLARLKRFFQREDPDYFEGIEEGNREENTDDAGETVTFKKAVA